MLDVGISSTLQIANFWGLAPAVTDKIAETVRNDASAREQLVEAPHPALRRAEADSRAKPQAKAASGIAKVIEDALRKAGLML